jgi:hypothetical protein
MKGNHEDTFAARADCSAALLTLRAGKGEMTTKIQKSKCKSQKSKSKVKSFEFQLLNFELQF